MKEQKLGLNDFKAVATNELLTVRGGGPPPILTTGIPWRRKGDNDNGGGGHQDPFAHCNKGANCCQNTVTNTIATLGNTRIHEGYDEFGNYSFEFFYSVSYLTQLGNEAYAVCRGYDVEGW